MMILVVVQMTQIAVVLALGTNRLKLNLMDGKILIVKKVKNVGITMVANMDMAGNAKILIFKHINQLNKL